MQRKDGRSGHTCTVHVVGWYAVVIIYLVASWTFDGRK